MKQILPCGALLAVCLSLSLARADQTDKKDDKANVDQEFVTKATTAGLAEVNQAQLAVKLARDAAVKKFAKKMIEDHGKANKELLALVNKKKLKSATKMDAEHKKMYDKLKKLSGGEFDRAYMSGQVKDHEDAVALFEKEGSSGKDDDLKKWAKEKLPTLRMHLKMAREINGKFKGGKKGQGGEG